MSNFTLRCQIVHGAKLSAVPNCPLYTPGAKLSGAKLSAVPNCPGAKLSYNRTNRYDYDVEKNEDDNEDDSKNR